MTASPQTVTAAEFVAELPPVNPAAVAAAGGTPGVPPSPPEAPTSAGEPASPEFDDKGNAYDPERHVHTKHPKTGCWMPRRRSAADNAGTGAAATSFVAPDAPPPAPPSEFRATAEAAHGIIVTVGVTVFGEEWLPSKGESASLVNAFEAYFKAKGAPDIPPGAALAIALLGYAGPRLQKPVTQSRLQKFRLWWQMKRAEWRGAHVAKVIHAAARP